LVDAFLHYRNENRLDREQRHRCYSEGRILHEDENEQRDQDTSLVQGLCDSVTDEAAQGLNLLGDHGNQLALAHPAEVRHWETQNATVQLVPETAQHPLAQASARHIQYVLEAAIDQNQQQKGSAEEKQIGDLV
jgi:hypothetical protein